MLITDLPKDKHYKFFEAAYMTALLSPGIGGNKPNTFRLGAAIVYRKRLLVCKFNLLKTHPQLLPFYKFPFLHAESHAIISLGLQECVDKDLYVVRVLKNNHLAISKPCTSCQKLIEYVGIRSVYYSTGINDGYERC